jgi:peptidoglycan hydrolase-like protein with peptidoglycan-binding domain
VTGARARVAALAGARARMAALAGAALVGAVVAFSLQGGALAPAAPTPPPLTTTAVVRTNLVNTVLTRGRLAYARAAPLVNELNGTYTKLPGTGARIALGGTLYRVDNVPVVLMSGSTPAWRELARGVSDGPDVAELQSSLIALGYADGLLSVPTGHFDVLTADAVRRWQRARGEPVTGKVRLGQVVFLTSTVRVGSWNLQPGQVASRGQEPYQVTTTARTVTVPLNPTLPLVHAGEAVRIIMPSGRRMRGRVSAVGTTAATVAPARPAATGTAASVAVQVSLTTQSVRHVLAVPVSALLALAGGGYGLEIVEPSGAHRLVGVRTGAFSGSRVQVSGAAIAAGTRVVVAQ